MHKYFYTKAGCYATNISMSIVGNLSPLLFLTFRDLYGISYTLLGLLILINFCTQLTVDLIFSFFSDRFNIPKVVKFTPVITIFGLIIYMLTPFIFKGNEYLGLAIGTVVFSSASGLCEVLISPVIAAIPAENPDREMSKLHSIYAWGVVAVVIITTLYIKFLGSANWQWLVLIFLCVPLAAAIFFALSEIPPMDAGENKDGKNISGLFSKGLIISVICIFLGGAAECTMAQWCSTYIEKGLAFSKLIGDIFGVALFSAMLGLGRSLYAKYGKKIVRVLFACSFGAFVCYFAAAVSNSAVVGMFACALTGLCVSMLWPGNLIMMTDKFMCTGVAAFALMAAGGDLGASIGPQLVGIITDNVMVSKLGADLAAYLSVSSEQAGMKLGMLVGALFPLVLTLIYTVIIIKDKKKEKIS